MIEYENSGMKEYNDRRRKTIKDVRDFLISINCNTELLSTEYINNRQKLKFRCECGTIFERNFSIIQHRKRCQCNHCARVKSWKEIRKSKGFENDYIKEFNKLGFKIIQESPISHSRDKVLVENKDGYRGYISLENARKGKMFSVFSIIFNQDNLLYNLNLYCSKNNSKTKVIKFYTENKKCIKIDCKCECGNLYSSNVGDFTTQYRIYCKECTKIQSNLEKIIKSELDNYNIKYIEQKRFDNCRSDITNYMLPFDFYLEDYNTIIEVDGEGHYKPINFRGISKEKSKQTYKRTIYNDKIKNKFCKNNNIKLIRIPYTEIKNNNYKNIIQTIIV